MTAVDQEEYDRISELVYTVVLEALSQKGVSFAVLRMLSKKVIPDLAKYDDYHINRWVSLVVTTMVRRFLARLGVDSDDEVMVFTCE